MAGKFIVTATVSGLAGSVLFCLTNLPGSAAVIAVATGSGQSAIHGHSFSLPLVAFVTDAYGNAISGVTVTFIVLSNAGAGGIFSGNQTTASVTTSAKGNAISPVLTANVTPGVFTVLASIAGGPEVLFTLTNL